MRKYPALSWNIFDRSFSYGTSLLCTESLSPPGHVWMPMLRRSSGVKRANSRLLRSMNSWSMSLPVQGLPESFLFARRPSVKSTDTRAAPAANVRLALVHDVLEELLARVPLDLAFEGIEQHHHRQGDHGLLDVPSRDLLVLLDKLRRVGLVAERAAGQLRELAASC